jgi:hypothetical protein
MAQPVSMIVVGAIGIMVILLYDIAGVCNGRPPARGMSAEPFARRRYTA